MCVFVACLFEHEQTSPFILISKLYWKILWQSFAYLGLDVYQSFDSVLLWGQLKDYIKDPWADMVVLREKQLKEGNQVKHLDA